MKRIMLMLGVIVFVVILIGADMRRQEPLPIVHTPIKKKCIGYTIIEFGKGIDCNGDTIKLVKRYGIQMPASQLNTEKAPS